MHPINPQLPSISGLAHIRIWASSRDTAGCRCHSGQIWSAAAVPLHMHAVAKRYEITICYSDSDSGDSYQTPRIES